MVDLLPKLKQSPLVSGTRQPDGDAVVMGCGISPTHVDHGASEEHLQPPQTEHRPAAPGVAGHLAVVRSPKSQNPKLPSQPGPETSAQTGKTLGG